MEDIDDAGFISKEEICEATYKSLIDEEDTKMKGSYFSLITGKKYAYNNLGDFIQLIFDHPKISPGSLIASRRYITINPVLFDKEIPNFFEIQKILTKLGKQNTYTRIFEPIKLLIKNAMIGMRFIGLLKITGFNEFVEFWNVLLCVLKIVSRAFPPFLTFVQENNNIVAKNII